MTIDIIIIPNYNGSELIKKNLQKVISATPPESKIIIVDDGSDDEEYKNLSEYINEISKKTKKVILKRYDKNMGFSTNVNRGVSQSNAELVVLLNSDIVPEDNFLSLVSKEFEENDLLFGMGMMDKSIENGNVVLRGRGIASFRRGFLTHKRGEVDSSDTFWVSGGSCILRRDIFENLGGFDSLYNPFYWEDIDLSYRARKAGYKIMFNNKIVVEHHHEEGAIKRNFDENRVKIVAYRNQFIFVWKNIGDINLLASHILWLPYHLLSALIRFDIAFIFAFLSAVISLPKIMFKRSEIQKLSKVSDKILFLTQ